MSLYFILLVSSVAVPLILSFDKKLQFWRQWKYLFPAIFTVATVYIFFDVLMTKAGVWGFNPRYHSNLLFFKLPIEEWLFFIIIPYASIFLHDAFVLYFPQIKLKNRVSKIITVALLFISVLLVLFNLNKTYTTYIYSTLIVTLAIYLLSKSNSLNHFYISFLLILIPFLIVNGVLTGSFIESEVVWYNNDENLGIRFFTIPIEDFAYGFSMIFLSLMLRDKLKNVY
ncbi:MAG: lycopene cyclase domain-containing protein [Bacteroidetes bacterium]|nr:MAG: lycopene cyclase domain-containing protein [Bacteroidota bacterium]